MTCIHLAITRRAYHLERYMSYDVSVHIHADLDDACVCVFARFGPGTLPSSCFDRVLLAVNSIVHPNRVCFLLLQVQGGCYTASPLIFASLLFSVAPPPHLITPRVSLQRACDSCKTLYQGVDLRCAAPFSPSLIPPSLILPFHTLLKCNPHPLRCPLCHCNVAICSRCCGADNSLFYLPLSSTKGPGH